MKHYAVVQTGTDAVFGIGNTREEAVKHSAENVCDENGVLGVDIETLEFEIERDRSRSCLGRIVVIDSADEDWKNYFQN